MREKRRIDNFRVRICRISHLKLRDDFGLLIVVRVATALSLSLQHGGFRMSNKLFGYLVVGALASALALASPALARGGGGMGGGGGQMGGGRGEAAWEAAACTGEVGAATGLAAACTGQAAARTGLAAACVGQAAGILRPWDRIGPAAGIPVRASPFVTGSSTIASTALPLPSPARPTTTITDPMITAGAECGRRMVRRWSMSVATTATENRRTTSL